MFRFVHRRIRLCLNLMRSLSLKVYAEQAVEYFLQLCMCVKRYELKLACGQGRIYQ